MLLSVGRPPPAAFGYNALTLITFPPSGTSKRRASPRRSIMSAYESEQVRSAMIPTIIQVCSSPERFGGRRAGLKGRFLDLVRGRAPH